ncbi:SRPBCC family protein [Streptomyces sp. NPDC001070]
MVHVQRSFVIRRPMPDVISYLADFGNAVQWDPGTLRCTRIDAGPVTEGAQWCNVSAFRGRRTELTYRLVHRADDRLRFIGNNKTAQSVDDLAFRSDGDATHVTYDATITFHGLARLADPLLKREFERLGDEVARTMPQAVEQALHP